MVYETYEYKVIGEMKEGNDDNPYPNRFWVLCKDVVGKRFRDLNVF